MRIAVFGASGFIGCHFVDHALKAGLEPTVYSGSTQGLANLCRRPVDLRLYRAPEISGLEIPEEIDLVVNFANPARSREGHSPEEQVDAFLALFRRFLERPGTRLIHYSTIAVYEPFPRGREVPESPLPGGNPSNPYAMGKLRMDRGLQEFPEERVLTLRPSIVYGPFSRFWTDYPLVALAAGDLAVGPLQGRMQPVFVGDLARFTVERCHDFRPGLYNFAGPETMTWREYYSFHQDIVGGGRIVDLETEPARPPVENLRADLREVQALLAGSPAVHSLLRRAGRYLPAPLGRPFRDLALRLARRTSRAARPVDLSRPAGPDSHAVPGATPHPGYLYEARHDAARPWYELDNLVSTDRLRRDFPGFRRTSLEENRELLARYFRFRFTDDPVT